MRELFACEIEKMMPVNEKIVLLNADLEKPNGLSKLRQKFPKRVLNVGIAEQNMACIAAGMASYGLQPCIFSFTPFVTRRICDQIAVSICYSNQNVKIFGTDPGISAEFNGGTHMSVEDVGVLRSIPNIVIFEPADNIQLKKMLPQIFKYDGPTYIRMFRKELKDIFSENEDFELFKAKIVKFGNDATIFCSGIMLQESLNAAEMLSKQNIDVEIINVHTIKPIDGETIVNSAKKTGAVVTAENHNIIGGLYSAVCEILIRENCFVPVKAIGINDVFGQVGKIDYLKKVYKMTANDIADKILELLRVSDK